MGLLPQSFYDSEFMFHLLSQFRSHPFPVLSNVFAMFQIFGPLFFVFPQHGTVAVSRNIMAGPALITEEWLDLEQHVSQALKLEEAQVSGRVAGDFAQKVAKFGPRNEEIKLRMIRIGIQNSLKK